MAEVSAQNKLVILLEVLDRISCRLSPSFSLILAELKARPSDIAVRIKLLNLYVDSGRTELALNHVTDIEKRQSHNTNLPWYQCVSHICEVSTYLPQIPIIR